MHMRGEELEMYALERLLPDQVSAAETHLTACRVCAEKLPDLVGFALQLQILSGKPLTANDERRYAHRIHTDEPARMRLLSPFSPDTFEIRVMDISRNGLRVSLASRLPVQTVAQVFCKRSIILGEVRYCVPIDSGYQAGISIQSIFPKVWEKNVASLFERLACSRT